MSRALAAWERWAFAPQTTLALSASRLALGAVLVYALLLLAPHLTLLFGDRAIVPLAAHQAAALPPNPTLLSLTGGAPAVIWALWGITLAAAACLTVGLYSRVAALVVYLGLLSLHGGNTLAVNGGDVVARDLVFWFILAPAGGGGALSVDAWRRRRRDPAAPPVAGWSWAQRMLQLQVVILYLSTSTWKARFPRWHDGSAMHEILASVDFHAPGMEQLLAWPELTAPLSWLVVAGELAIGPLLLLRRTRWLGIALGLCIHGYIAIFMRIPVFGPVMWSTYLAFLDEDQVRRLLPARLR